MAQFVLGAQEAATLDTEAGAEAGQREEAVKRHYKKDSRYLEDLYTLTFYDDSSIDQDDLETQEQEAAAKKIPTGLTSLQVPKKTHESRFRTGLVRSQSSGPMSLNLVTRPGPAAASEDPLGRVTAPDPKLQFASSTLDTNLHKILARRLAGGQPVSYDSCKLLTKAYYKLLRDPASCQLSGSAVPRDQLYTHNCTDTSILSWQTLVKTDMQQLKNIVAGYTGLARSLNDQLMSELMAKDELLAEQDRMLDTISEMTDNLL